MDIRDCRVQVQQPRLNPSHRQRIKNWIPAFAGTPPFYRIDVEVVNYRCDSEFPQPCGALRAAHDCRNLAAQFP